MLLRHSADAGTLAARAAVLQDMGEKDRCITDPLRRPLGPLRWNLVGIVPDLQRGGPMFLVLSSIFFKHFL